MSFACSDKNVTSDPVLDEDEKIQCNESGIQTHQKDWSRLDSAILERIYSFLSRTDQFNMSLVCKNWLREYESPHLWRNFKFYLPSYVCPCEDCPNTKFPRKFSKFFRHVEIISKRVRTSLVDDTFIQLKLFLDFITNKSRLKSIRFKGMNKYFIQLEDDDYLELFESTKTFFAKQQSLELVEFHDSFYLREEGADILKVACENSALTLKTVIIKGFVTDSIEIEGTEVDDFDLYRSLKRYLVQLTTIRADYTQLLENIIMTRSEETEPIGELSMLEVVCEGSKRLRFQGIHPQAWKCLCRLCPKLKVRMKLTSTYQPRNDYSFYIVPYIPIEVLEYRIVTPLDSRYADIGDFLRHLVHCGCNDHLEGLTMVWTPVVEHLSIHLVPFLQVTPKLRILCIYLRHPVYDIKNVFFAWLQKRPPCLEYVSIFIADVRSEEDFQFLNEISEMFTPLLEILGVKISLETRRR